ncbi:uncharacterized protein [Panulirus ornatus]|uniref:uncharacterized protein n=1 Tax=Panulirus ornatus TaxID=150431 RepID=UPI003A8C27DC
MVRTSVLMVSLALHLATCDPYLFNDCIVEDTGREVEMTTFEDEVAFRLASVAESDVFVTITQGSIRHVLRIRDLDLYTWQVVQLILTGESKLMYQNKTIGSDSGESIRKGTRKSIKIENAHVLWHCEEGWPNRELGKEDDANKIIALSGRDEENLILKPTENTTVSFSISGKQMTLCEGQDHDLKVVNATSWESQCVGDLKQDTRYRLRLRFDDLKSTVQVFDGKATQLASFQYTEKKLRFLRINLEGSLYILQCLEPCWEPSDSGSSSAGLSVLPITIAVAVLLSILQALSPSSSPLQLLLLHADSS